VHLSRPLKLETCVILATKTYSYKKRGQFESLSVSAQQFYVGLSNVVDKKKLLRCRHTGDKGRGGIAPTRFWPLHWMG
jgi:hypothetical protein